MSVLLGVMSLEYCTMIKIFVAQIMDRNGKITFMASCEGMSIGKWILESFLSFHIIITYLTSTPSYASSYPFLDHSSVKLNLKQNRF